MDFLIELMGLGAFREKLTGELSTGTRRIVELAGLLASDPSVIVLDEPSGGVAQKESEALGPLLRRVQGVTGSSILVIEHDMPLLSGLCDRMVALELGVVIAEGTPGRGPRPPPRDRVVPRHGRGGHRPVGRANSLLSVARRWQALEMLARMRHLTFDCQDHEALAEFWGAVLGFVDDPENPNHPGDPMTLLVDPRGLHPGLLFIPVPEGKSAKNRLHLDLQPQGRRDEAVEQVVALGGAVLADHRGDDGRGWVVLADPEGNELCMEQSAAERGGVSAVVTAERELPSIHATDERTLLTGMLDWYRDGVIQKVQGVRPHHASAVPLSSATSIAGLVKHLALVEDYWFTVRFEGEPVPAPFTDIDWEDDPDWEFHSAVSDPFEDLVELYRAAIERSAAVVERHQLDDIGVDTSRRTYSLRFLLVHLIEETARHLGHLDILRELLDGQSGE